MRLSKNTLMVMVNPFCAPLGEDGRAMALVAHDPSEKIGRDYVGARVLPVVTESSKARKGNPFGASVKVAIEYRLKPEKVPHTPHYVAQLKSGETFAVDQDTARLAGASFPADAAERMRRAALAAALAHGGPVLEVWTKQGLGALAPQAPAPMQEGSFALTDAIDQAARLGAEEDGDS